MWLHKRLHHTILLIAMIENGGGNLIKVVALATEMIKPLVVLYLKNYLTWLVGSLITQG